MNGRIGSFYYILTSEWGSRVVTTSQEMADILLPKIREHYRSIFRRYDDDDTLFEVYDVNKEEYIKFNGKEGVFIMNKETVMVGLIVQELNISDGKTVTHEVKDLLVFVHAEQDSTDFTKPVFIGAVDSFMENRP